MSAQSRRWSPVTSFSGADTGLSRFLFPADVTGSAGPDFVGLDLDLVFTSAEGAELMRVPLRFERRWFAGATVDAWGFDSTKAAAAHVHALRSGDWSMDVRAAGDRLTASQVLLLIELVELMKPGNRVALTRPGAAPTGSTLLQNLQPGPPVPEGMESVIRALARLEDYAREPIIVPETLRQSAIEDIQVAAELLSGRAVKLEWEHTELPVTAAEARGLAVGALGRGPAVLDIKHPFRVDLGGGQHYDLDPVSSHYASVQVATWPETEGLPDDAEVVLALRPAGEDRTVTLAFRPSAKPADGLLEEVPDPVTWVSPEVFDELVASLDEPSKVPPALAEAAARLRALRA
jgi:hypothetical protein